MQIGSECPLYWSGPFHWVVGVLSLAGALPASTWTWDVSTLTSVHSGGPVAVQQHPWIYLRARTSVNNRRPRWVYYPFIYVFIGTHTHTHPLPGIGPLRTKAEDGQTRMWITMGIRVYDRMKAPFHQSRHSVSYLPACQPNYLHTCLCNNSPGARGWKRTIWMCPEFV